MERTEDMIKIDFAENDNFEELVEELFWEDLYFEEMDGLHIHDTNQGKWYAVENRYWYAGSMYILNSGESVDFGLVDKDFNNELQETYDEDF